MNIKELAAEIRKTTTNRELKRLLDKLLDRVEKATPVHKSRLESCAGYGEALFFPTDQPQSLKEAAKVLIKGYIDSDSIKQLGPKVDDLAAALEREE